LDKEYQAYLNSKQWKAKRKIILKRDKVCVECKSNKATDCHHLTYRHKYKERDYELVGVCRECHEYIHHKRPTPGKKKPKIRKRFIVVLALTIYAATYSKIKPIISDLHKDQRIEKLLTKNR